MDTMSAEELAKWLDEMAQWFAELTADTVGENNCRVIASLLRAIKPQSAVEEMPMARPSDFNDIAAAMAEGAAQERERIITEMREWFNAQHGTPEMISAWAMALDRIEAACAPPEGGR